MTRVPNEQFDLRFDVTSRFGDADVDACRMSGVEHGREQRAPATIIPFRPRAKLEPHKVVIVDHEPILKRLLHRVSKF
jgi:hypothetical protein